MLALMRTVAIIAFTLVTNCAQTPEPSRLIEEINADKARIQKILEAAERKRAAARAKVDAADLSAKAILLTEAAKLYGELSTIQKEMADKADQVAKVRNPEWYSEYFTTYAKYFRSMAAMAAGAEEQLTVNSKGGPTELQLKSWKADAEQLNKETDELWKKIEAIEVREKVVLIK